MSLFSVECEIPGLGGLVKSLGSTGQIGAAICRAALPDAKLVKITVRPNNRTDEEDWWIFPWDLVRINQYEGERQTTDLVKPYFRATFITKGEVYLRGNPEDLLKALGLV